jgi:hypothetical protein
LGRGQGRALETSAGEGGVSGSDASRDMAREAVTCLWAEKEFHRAVSPADALISRPATKPPGMVPEKARV